MLKKINNETIASVVSIIGLILSIVAIVGVINNASYSKNLTMRETYSDLVIRTKIECLKNPSESCDKEVDRVQKQLDQFIQEELSK